jgi:hypothetical protein
VIPLPSTLSDKPRISDWDIPHKASVVCAGLACVDMELNNSSGGQGGEAIETFSGVTYIGGGR